MPPKKKAVAPKPVKVKKEAEVEPVEVEAEDPEPTPQLSATSNQPLVDPFLGTQPTTYVRRNRTNPPYGG
jgi:hypothetical protein